MSKTMPPKGGPRQGRRNESANNQQRTTNTQGQQGLVSPTVVTRPNRPTQPKFGIAPLILEGAKLNKLELNDLLKIHLAEVKLNNIQLARNGNFTIYANDVKSFNQLINELSTILNNNGSPSTKVYVPRTIQKVQDTEKVAFAKGVDAVIPVDRITDALSNKGLAVAEVIRLQNKDKTGNSQTVKIVLSDTLNRNTLVQTGLQIDYMHFVVEPAKQNNTPIQCFKCQKYNHVAKYCKSEHLTCARYGENHQTNQCTATDDAIKCSNCKGNHVANSSNCPTYQGQKMKMQKMIDQYTKTSNQATTAPSLRSTVDFPAFAQHNQPQKSILTEHVLNDILTTLTSKMESILEETVSRIFNNLNKKMRGFERKLNRLYRTNAEDDQATSNSESSEEETTKELEKNQPREETTENQTTTTNNTSTKPKPPVVESNQTKTQNGCAGPKKRVRSSNGSPNTSNNAPKGRKISLNND